MKICKQCGKEFESKTRKKYCSAECAYKATLKLNRGYYREKRQVAPHVCVECGKSYIPNIAYQKYCSKKCQNKASYRAEKERERAARVKVKPTEQSKIRLPNGIIIAPALLRSLADDPPEVIAFRAAQEEARRNWKPTTKTQDELLDWVFEATAK